MTAITFDTYKVVKRLTSEGISEKQAQVIVDVIQESQQYFRDVRDEDVSRLATKADLRELELATTARLGELKAELIKWMFGGFVAIIGLLVTVLVKLH